MSAYTPGPPGGHTQGERTKDGGYRYWCDVCGVECTAGSPAGPSTSDGGIHRCYACYRAYDARLALVRVAAPDMLRVLRVAVAVARDRHARGEDLPVWFQDAEAAIANVEPVLGVSRG